MRLISNICCGAILLIFHISANAQTSSEISKHTLKGKIIRSFTVHHDNDKMMLVGLKGQPGEGKIQISHDAGVSWNVLNDDKTLCETCEDVQSVLFVSTDIILAGTWKNGLFISTNGGKKFDQVKKFPALDVRSLVLSPSGAIFAATTTHGIQTSDDNGKSWSSTHKESLNKDLSSWKIAMPPNAHNILYAMTFNKGLMKSMDGGKTWKQAIYEEGVMIWDIGFINNEQYAVGSSKTENYLFHSYLGDKKWKKYKLNMNGSINALNIANTFIDYELMLGTWKNGLQTTYAIEYSNDGYRCVEIIKDDTIGVADIWSNKEYVYNFSWGDGVKMLKRDLDCEIIIPSIATEDCKSEPCFEIYANCEVDYWNFKLYNRWGEFFMKDSTGIESTNKYINNLQNFKEAGQYIYWLKTSFENNVDTVSVKGFITVDF